MNLGQNYKIEDRAKVLGQNLKIEDRVRRGALILSVHL